MTDTSDELTAELVTTNLSQPPTAKRRLRLLLTPCAAWLARVLTAWVIGIVRRFRIQADAERTFSSHGYHLLRKHYYLPIPIAEELTAEYWNSTTGLVGLDMNDEHALRLLRDVFPPYIREFRARFQIERATEREPFYLLNENFMAADAHVYYAFVRNLKPRRIIEIGSGYSTLVAIAAMQKNAESGASPGRITAIEPYPSATLQAQQDALFELVPKRVQDVPVEEFASLEPGDILFIDSTHALRAGGDVEYEFADIIPKIKPGVFIHVHDIYLPQRYPRPFIEQFHSYWNEQTVLQTLLCYSTRFEVLWPGQYLLTRFPAEMHSAFPEIAVMHERFPWVGTPSFWMQVR